MSRRLLPVSISAALMGGTVLADVPNVAADIAPVHSLVAMVMEGVGTPALVISPGASPHEHNLRPSEAAALQEADLVFWLGEDLTPWMEGAIETLASGATVTTLLETDGTILHDFRESTLFEAHEHGEEGDHDEHAEDRDHDGHDHEEHAEDDDHNHEEHAEHEGHDDHDNHGHGDHDPHAWLSPDNAETWLNLIAAQLSSADPDNAGAYFANAAAARAEMDALSAEVAGILEPVRGGSFIVFHDAYQYFEDAFDFPASGAISLSDASDPSPSRIAEIQGRIHEEGIDCVLAEPQFNQGIVNTVLDGTDAKTGVIDPLGSDLEPGKALYAQVIRNMANTLAECLN
ncbi:zinc ABC transporter substrate-binding protein [Ruegeria lacuscaerulensis]|uniref:zinc ABC transporter substrate-binding protein n=1 Tax=Ruegeria lacuscaerulensis TaxID=55218 RepID=UPI00147A1541|nr:zinc ABC transporter substrate-binding protein [Ruegeria lacuscaerulensis]